MMPKTQTARPERPTVPNASRARRAAWALAGLWLAGLCGPCGAELYRWVDETGKTVYSQTPPPGQTPATTVKVDKAPPPTVAPEGAEQLREALEKDFDQRAQQAQAAEGASKKAAQQAARKTNCETARTNLETLRTRGGGRLRTPDGQAKFLSREELARYEAEARQQIKDNCD